MHNRTMENDQIRYLPIPWIDSVTEDPARPWLTRFSTTSPHTTLLASCFAALARELYGNLENLSVSQREAWAQYIAQHQSAEDGLFYDPGFSENDLVKKRHGIQYLSWQFTFFSLAALNALQARAAYPLRFLDGFFAENSIEAWLDSQDWSDPWMVSNRIMFLSTFLIQESEREENVEYRLAVKRIFDWLDRHQNPETGYWDLGRGASLHYAMAGAFHFYFIYFYLGRKVNYPEQIIDHTLALQHQDGLFSPSGGGGACLDLDAVDILVKFSLLVDYRADDVKSALTRAFQAVLKNQNPDGGFCEARRPPLWQKSRKRKLLELFGIDRLLNRPWQGRPVEYQNYSGWGKMRHRVDESELWASWFRPLTLALISRRYPGEFNVDHPWCFHKSPTLGWHDDVQLEVLRARFYQ